MVALVRQLKWLQTLAAAPKMLHHCCHFKHKHHANLVSNLKSFVLMLYLICLLSAGCHDLITFPDLSASEPIHTVFACLSAVLNGSSHSPTSLNGAPSTPNGFSNGPAMSSTASLSNQQLPPACGARQLCKLKRFLTTLQQFGNDISPEIGERVRSLVLGLVVSNDCHPYRIILQNH